MTTQPQRQELVIAMTCAPSGHRCGESHPKSSITDSEVRQMRDKREKQGWSYGRIALHFKRNVWTVRDIVTYATRKTA